MARIVDGLPVPRALRDYRGRNKPKGMRRRPSRANKLGRCRFDKPAHQTWQQHGKRHNPGK